MKKTTKLLLEIARNWVLLGSLKSATWYSIRRIRIAHKLAKENHTVAPNTWASEKVHAELAYHGNLEVRTCKSNDGSTYGSMAPPVLIIDGVVVKDSMDMGLMAEPLRDLSDA